MTTFRKYPTIDVRTAGSVSVGWDEIGKRLHEALGGVTKPRKIIVVEYYQGMHEADVTRELAARLHPDVLITAESVYHDPAAIREMVHADVTDDRLFGHLTRLEIDAFFNPVRLSEARKTIDALRVGTVLVVGTGAAAIAPESDVLVYADMARWEIQRRMRRHEVSNVGMRNSTVDDWMLLYKQGYFVDWRVCDRLKRTLLHRCDFVLDTNTADEPRCADGASVREGFAAALTQPFSVVPFFDPGPWGGQWMKDVCGLDPSAPNYAWCFNCVPEENSMLLKINGTVMELPAIDLVFFSPRRLLGDDVHARFGDEFPIRFDFLDTMGGGNLSLQVHPLAAYIRETFGMPYTQDESYYMMDAKEGAVVYLGLKDGIDPGAMIADLERAQAGGAVFDAEKYVQTWPAAKHDHFLIPAGTVHCSGKDSMVLEISATPYIFTFKLWDWGRLGLDGRPRPINIAHGKNVIQWERTTTWTRSNLVGRVEIVAEGNGWIEERTGLHELEFIETRRHRFTATTFHATHGTVNVVCLVGGREATVESPTHAFEPRVVHYAETFIVPACVGEYMISPVNASEECITVKAYVRA